MAVARISDGGFCLGSNKQASAKFAKLSQRGVPKNALVVSTIVVSVSALLSKFMPDDAFSLVTAISAICFILSNSSIE